VLWAPRRKTGWCQSISMSWLPMKQRHETRVHHVRTTNWPCAAGAQHVLGGDLWQSPKMVRLTRELLERARGFVNPMKERELDLRGTFARVRVGCFGGYLCGYPPKFESCGLWPSMGGCDLCVPFQATKSLSWKIWASQWYVSYPFPCVTVAVPVGNARTAL
jgi:hypothetical protein